MIILQKSVGFHQFLIFNLFLFVLPTYLLCYGLLYVCSITLNGIPSLASYVSVMMVRLPVSRFHVRQLDVNQGK